MPKTDSFVCPTCGASLTTDGSQIEVQCSFCGNTVIVPQALRSRTAQSQAGQPAQQPQVFVFQQEMTPVQLPPEYQPKRRSGCSAGCLALFIIGIVLLTTALPILLATGMMNSITAMINQITNPISGAKQEATTAAALNIAATARARGIAQPTSTNESIDISGVLSTTMPGSTATPAAPALPTGTPGFANLVASFSSKGTGPGFLTDARGVAVDGSGGIYVSEYSSGRIQKFDSSGKFIKGWVAEGKNPVRGLAADRNANVYVIRDGVILKYNGGTGDLQSKIKGGDYYDDIAAMFDGGLEAFAESPSDDLIRFNAKGGQVTRIHSAVSKVIEQPSPLVRIAVDGTGNIFALDSIDSEVFKFTPDGKFVNKFGGKGEENGQFSSPNAIAIDGQGRIYVSDFSGVQVFDGNGRYMDRFTLPSGSIASGMIFNDKNELFIAAREKILKYTLGQ